jgi:hypothetical protein
VYGEDEGEGIQLIGFTYIHKTEGVGGGGGSFKCKRDNGGDLTNVRLFRIFTMNPPCTMNKYILTKIGEKKSTFGSGEGKWR